MSAGDFSDQVGPPPRSAVLVCFSDVQPEAVSWLWHPYIPRGKVTLLEGDPAAGKTWLALAIAAAVSRGWGLPDSDSGRPNTSARGPERVVYMSAEDGIADTLRPRLDRLGADVSFIHALTAAQNGDAEAAVTLQDIDVLEDALTRTGAAMLIVDPIQAFVGANVDMHRANEVRPVLARLSKLAEQYNCAVLCIRHLSKASADRALYRGLGSIDFTAAARSVLLAGRDPSDTDRRALVQIKNSLAHEGTALTYAIEDDCFMWCGLSDLTASGLLAADASESDRSALDEAKDLLSTLLNHAPRPTKDVEREARAAGIADRTLRRAKAELGVRSQKVGEVWHWLPAKGANNAKQNLGTLGTLDLDEGVIP